MRKNTIRVTATVATVLSTLMLSHQVLAAEKVDFPLFTPGQELHTQKQTESEQAEGEEAKAPSESHSSAGADGYHEANKPYEEIDHEAIEKEELQRLKENPIGEGDPTTRTENTHLAPYRSLVRVSSYFGDYNVNEEHKWSRCSGTVIGRDTVLTAAHCVEDSYRKLATSGFVTAGFKNEKGEYATFEIEEFIPHKIWYGRYGAFKYDMAILKIKPNSEGQHIGDVLGIVPIRQTHESRVGEKVRLSGYPAEIVDAVGISQWGASGTIIKEDAYAYTADIFTHGGQSGSALLNEQNELIGTLSTGGYDESNFIKMRPGIMEWLIENEAIPGSERNDDDEDEDVDDVEDNVKDVEKDTQKDPEKPNLPNTDQKETPPSKEKEHQKEESEKTAPTVDKDETKKKDNPTSSVTATVMPKRSETPKEKMEKGEVAPKEKVITDEKPSTEMPKAAKTVKALPATGDSTGHALYSMFGLVLAGVTLGRFKRHSR